MEDGFLFNVGTPSTLPYTASSWNSSSDCDGNPRWDDSFYQYSQLESSPASSSFAIRQLIGKLGNICDSSPSLVAPTPGSYSGNSEVTINASCYSTPLDSIPLDSVHLPALSAEPGFAERAAEFSRFGSRSFNGRKSQLGLSSNCKMPYRSATMCRVSSTNALKQARSPLQNQKYGAPASQLHTVPANSNEASSVSEQLPSGSISPGDLNPRKRKTASRGKAIEDDTDGGKGVETDHNSSPKRSKMTDDITEDYCSQKQSKANQKPLEPSKDYIHVRARRGQATDSHSLAERVRREKISERMKLLQDLVPGCNKVTGKALMLDEIINYVQSLQRQVEFLSMKLSSVNPSLDFNNDNSMPKDICQPNASMPQNFHAMHHNQLQPHQQHNNFSNVDPALDRSLCHIMGMQLPPLDGFGETLSQFPAATCDDDLQSVVQMGLNQTPTPERI
ncbi:unnamed protein product [Cuscuta epithymum]|uniref:BHLH domain-containing protein n=1 Tax=Cuscuta epithymum TaxID=186058 RepID=A0AAV0FSS4_9ASTE|nr:unnamed protein product [Cuscuta epithymum]